MARAARSGRIITAGSGLAAGRAAMAGLAPLLAMWRARRATRRALARLTPALLADIGLDAAAAAAEARKPFWRV
ncbi:DUF1127 domain-containing protein [Albidovulum sp.]